MTTLSDSAARARRVTVQGMVVNALLAIVKALAGVFAHSQALLADAAHTVSDFASDAAVLLGLHYSSKPVDEDHDYGHGQYETLAAVAVGLILFGAGAKLGWDAVGSLLDAIGGKLPGRPGALAFWAAVVSIVAKEALFRVTYSVGKATGNDSLIANAWHHRSDAFSSVATALGAGAAAFLGERWSVMDPVAAMFTSFLLLKVAWDIVRDKVGALTDRSLPREQEEEIRNIILSLPELSSPHNLRTHEVGHLAVIDVHVRVNPESTVKEAHDVVSRLEELLRRRFGRDTIANVHIEPWKESR